MSALEEGHIDTNYHEGVDLKQPSSPQLMQVSAPQPSVLITTVNQLPPFVKELKPEHVNRFGSVVMFNSISLDAYKNILKSNTMLTWNSSSKPNGY